jgi:hypothetical protein
MHLFARCGSCFRLYVGLRYAIHTECLTQAQSNPCEVCSLLLLIGARAYVLRRLAFNVFSQR